MMTPSWMLAMVDLMVSNYLAVWQLDLGRYGEDHRTKNKVFKKSLGLLSRLLREGTNTVLVPTPVGFINPRGNSPNAPVV